MGRKGSCLVPFLIKGLKENTYGSFLIYVDEINDVFRLTLPRKAKNVHYLCIDILKAWDAIKGHVGDFDFTKAKQRLTSALKKSDFLEHLPDSRYPLTYKFLSSEEIKAKKENKKKKSCSLKYSAPLSVESGYGSLIDSPYSAGDISEDESIATEFLLAEDLIPDPSSGKCFQVPDDKANSSGDILAAIKHDHNFGVSLDESVKHFNSLTDSHESGRSLMDIDNRIKDFHFPFLEKSEIDEILDDVFDSPLSFQEMKNEFTEFLNIPKFNSTKVYRIKSENLLGETILFTCEPVDAISTNEFTYIAPGVALNNDDIKRTYNHQITKMISKDNHLLLFLKPFTSFLGKC